MNTLITILVFAFILLTAVVIAFLAGLHAAKLGVREIIRDTIIKSKKEEEYRYDCIDSDYEDDDEEETTYPYKAPTKRVIEEHYSLHREEVPQQQQQQNYTIKSQHRYVGDDLYLARIMTRR